MCWTFSWLLIRQIEIGSSLKGHSADFLLTVCECLPYCCLGLLLCSFLTLMTTLRWFRVASHSISFLILNCFSSHQLKSCCLRCICVRRLKNSSIYVNLLTKSWVMRNIHKRDFHKRTVLEMMVAVQFSVILFILELIQAFPRPLITFCLDSFGLFFYSNCL